jgi:hypothetical protein
MVRSLTTTIRRGLKPLDVRTDPPNQIKIMRPIGPDTGGEKKERKKKKFGLLMVT